MRRASFIGGTAATLALTAGGRAMAQTPRLGTRVTLAGLLAAYPSATAGDVVQYELGFGAQYDKQIGFGDEHDRDVARRYVETQVGNGDHACNPNTLKKIYLSQRHFSNVFTPYAAAVYVARSSNMMTRWGDGVGPAAAPLLLLDAKTLYDPRPARVTAVGHERLTMRNTTVTTTRVAGRYDHALDGRLHTFELWLSPDVPLALVRMDATAPGLDPYSLSLYTFGRAFKTSLAMSLDTVRLLTGNTGDVPVLAQ
ncbi:MAG TPA: hypothetical protein VMD91_15255 [Candidatus Sulfotelmatobacter sp.]|nr:hypothetical protein [Candidatus Sulfotelmatobacter sp.]